MKTSPAKLVMCALICGFAADASAGGPPEAVTEVVTPSLMEQRALAFFDRVDMNRDGKIDLNDWKEFESREFDALDRNHDGVLNNEDFPSGAVPAEAGANHTLTKADALSASMDEFKLIDTDGDGVLSKAEVLAYTAKLKP